MATRNLQLLPLLENALAFRRKKLEAVEQGSLGQGSLEQGPLEQGSLEQGPLDEGPASHSRALRLFNGFWEGFPGLAVELYDRTLVILLYEEASTAQDEAVRTCQDFYQAHLGDQVDTLLLKNRTAAEHSQRQGVLLHGSQPAQQVQENGVWYALDLQMHQDTSLFLDTRGLRTWAKENLSGASVLNTFAYTGSLGAAAKAGGARSVLQTDLSPEFLAVARRTYVLNGWELDEKDFVTGDFFPVMARLNNQRKLFDCVFIDPPFFSVTSRGRVDILGEYTRLINKVRPLVGHGGALVAVNNAVFLPGADYLSLLQDLCASGYMQIEALIPVPPDFTGFMASPAQSLPADPAPFNHSTKIAVLRVQRKDGRQAE